jgi:hypothetical protein
LGATGQVQVTIEPGNSDAGRMRHSTSSSGSQKNHHRAARDHQCMKAAEPSYAGGCGQGGEGRASFLVL